MLGLNLQIPPRRSSRRREQSGRVNRARRSDPIPPAVEVVLTFLPRLQREEARKLAKQWVEKGFDAAQIRLWAQEFGIHGHHQAALCWARGLSAASLRIKLNGIALSQRIRGGESVDSVLALAETLGIPLVA
jgi:L-alanine-DL-glutamate epimerase-like enolase superfamily enzyme